MPRGHLTVVANTADDDEFWGLLVSPDVDATIYRLAGVFNENAGYGVKDDTFQVLEELGRIGEPTWFRVGDKDFATHVVRAEMLRRGRTLTETALALCERFGVETRVLPMTDDRVRTRFTTDRGELSFQEYFVRERLGPALRSIDFEGIDAATPTREVLSALQEADLVVIGPSNPLISIAPILRVIGPRMPRELTVAITPIVGGASLKGPTVEMMRAVGPDPNPVEVARLYRGVAAGFVLDSRDQALAGELEELGFRTMVLDTVMSDGGDRLAAQILGAFSLPR
ncbi:MAG: 2-phospho-L-lactate transferase CofD family protein [Candidatus Dormibacteraeota bacterium]|nr:2-phospho-L-lactate transferase CofD family protein [Candidatus Dormibacteraeota bacterium]